MTYCCFRFLRLLLGKSCIVLLLIGITFFCNGCLVLTSQRLSKPIAPDQLVQLCETNNYPSRVFHRYFNSDDFRLDVYALNGENRGQIDFWFYILPVPDSPHQASKPSPILTVEIQIEPKPGHSVLFDPTRTFYSSTNLFRVSPAHIWLASDAPGYGNFRKSPYEIASKTVPLTTNALFILQYEVNSSPDIPFDLFLEGCSMQDRDVSLPSLSFAPVTIHRLEFKLPY
jgi:hypothetical protein